MLLLGAKLEQSSLYDASFLPVKSWLDGEDLRREGKDGKNRPLIG